MVRCKGCEVTKPKADFYDIRKTGKFCRECIKAKRKAGYTALDARARRSRMLLKYGLNADTYEDILSAQGGGCAICGVTVSGDARRPNLVVDHDHSCCPGRESCGKCVRGLLCVKCNVGLGSFDDDPEKLTRALSYLDGIFGV